MLGDQGSIAVRDRKKRFLISLLVICIRILRKTPSLLTDSDGIAVQAPWVPDIFQAVSEITGPGAIGAVEAETIGDT